MAGLSVKSLGSRLLVCYPIVSRLDLGWINISTMSLAWHPFSNTYMIGLSVKSLGSRLLVCYPRIVSRLDLGWINISTMSLD